MTYDKDIRMIPGFLNVTEGGLISIVQEWRRDESVGFGGYMWEDNVLRIARYVDTSITK